MLKSTAFKVFKLVNSNEKIDFLAFTCIITALSKSHWNEETGTTQHCLSKKEIMERRAIVPVNETKQVQHFEPRTWFSICIVGLSTELCFKVFHMD